MQMLTDLTVVDCIDNVVQVNSRLVSEKARRTFLVPSQGEVRCTLASSPGRQLKKKDGLVSVATMLVCMHWPLPETRNRILSL